MRIVSVDIETTGLDPRRHEVWEAAVVPVGTDGLSRCYQFPVTLCGSTDEALAVGYFVERYKWPPPNQAIHCWPSGTNTIESLSFAVATLHDALKGVQLLGCSVHFDAAFLAELFRRQGLDPEPWHHRFLDLGSFAAGAWGAKKPLASQSMADRIPNPNAHSALADAEWNVKVYERITA